MGNPRVQELLFLSGGIELEPCVCLYICVCVCERERERHRVHVTAVKCHKNYTTGF